METNKFLEDTIEQVKQIAKLGDSPIAYIKDANDKMIVTLFAVQKEVTKLSLYNFVKMGAKEIVLVNEAFYLNQENKDPKKMISEHKDAKECFVVSYFSKDKELGTMLPFHREKIRNKEILVWDERPKGLETLSSTFNPFKMSEEEIKRLAVEVEKELIKSNGKKEIIKLPRNFRIEIFRHKGKVYFDTINSDNEVFGTTVPMDDDEEFKKRMIVTKKIFDIVDRDLI